MEQSIGSKPEKGHRKHPANIGTKSDGTHLGRGDRASGSSSTVIIMCIVVIGLAFAAFLVLRPRSANVTPPGTSGSGHSSTQSTHLPEAQRR